MQVIGYVDRLSARPGEEIACHVSLPHDGEVELDVVRLIHGDENPAGPGFKVHPVAGIARQVVAATPQSTPIGSCMVAEGVWGDAPGRLTMDSLLWPTMPTHRRRQGLISLRGADGDVLALALSADGRIELISGAGSQLVSVCATETALTARTWYRVQATIDEAAHSATLGISTLAGSMNPGMDESSTREGFALVPAYATCLVGALSCTCVDGRAFPDECFNGKLERPRLIEGVTTSGTALADWRFELDMEGHEVTDVSGRNKHGRLINMPARAMTGHLWTGEELSHRHAPGQYAAVHFHEDDLEDAGWEESARIQLPETVPSGTYAVRLRAGTGIDHVPFFITTGHGQERAPVTFLAPTFTYLAYANEHLLEREPHSIPLGPHDRAVADHPEFGLSLYDHHSDGSGVCYASSRRPLLNMRPDYRSWVHNAPRHLSADLYVIDWLERAGVPYDVVTDHDLHREGLTALDGSSVVITGSHPEYVSTQMLDALDEHLASGGRLMYLGGNGFYWVTSQDRNREYIIEVRRGVAGTRTWESEPGETYHSTTGEPGGLWRHRGKPPNALAGVGFSAQLTGVRSASARAGLRAPGYRRLSDSFRADAAFVFEGITRDEVIGDFGLIMDGASGDEIDRYDVERGSPPGALVLAQSTGHSELYLLCSEDVAMTSAKLAGPDNDLVRSDMVLYKLPGGGAVFAVGSICFSGSLSHNDYDNNVARLTTNVLREFLHV